MGVYVCESSFMDVEFGKMQEQIDEEKRIPQQTTKHIIFIVKKQSQRKCCWNYKSVYIFPQFKCKVHKTK